MGVENVDVVQAHAGKGLIDRGNQVLARTTIAIRPGPHVIAGLARDDQLIAVGLPVRGKVLTKVGLGRAVGRAVVIREIEVGDTVIEGGTEHVALGDAVIGVSEVVPQAERDAGQLEP